MMADPIDHIPDIELPVPVITMYTALLWQHIKL